MACRVMPLLALFVAVCLVPPAHADMTTRAAQFILRDLDHYKGVIDGDMGPLTKTAIKSFQRANAVEPTGRLDERTLGLLRLTRGPTKVAIGRSLRRAMREGFEHLHLSPDWSTMRDLHAFSFSYREAGMTWSYVHICGQARFTGRGGVSDAPVPFMMDIILDLEPDEPPIAALLRDEVMVSDIWTGDYIFVESFCTLRVGSAVALGLVR